MFYIYADGVSIYDPSNPAYIISDPKLTVEFGKAGSFEFSIPSSNLYYNSLHQMKTIISVTIDGTELFRGRVLNYTKDFNNSRQVYCEGDLAYLVDSVQKGDKYSGTAHALFRKIIAAHNARVEAYKQFTVGNITIEDRSVNLTGRDENPDEGEIDYKQIALNSITDEWNNSFDFIQTCLIDYCGGYLKTRRVGNTTYIDLLGSYTDTAAQEVKFGVNLLDLTEEISEEDLFTVLIPLGDDNLTVASVNGGSDEISDSAAVATYGRIIRTHVFSNVTSASTLLENGRRYLAEHSNVPVSITVKAVDLHFLDPSVTTIQVGQRVHINSSPHKLVEYLTCTKIEYDLANPENTSYTFGNPKQTLTQRYREDKRAQSDTYGNGSESIGSYGGYASGIGAVGDAQAADIAKAKTEVKNEVREEWIDIDPNNPDGIGSIGGLYRLLKGQQAVLENQVGIDFNAEEGNINLHAISKKLDETTGKVSTATAKTEEIAADVDGKFTAMSRTIAQMETDAGTRQATWEVWANEMETGLRGKADRFEVEAVKTSIKGEFEKTNSRFSVLKSVGIDVDAVTGNININSLSKKIDENRELIRTNEATIKARSDENTSSIQMLASTVAGNKTNIASVTALTTQLGSQLELKADKTVVVGDLEVINGKISAINGEIDVLKAKKITTDEINAALAIMDRVAIRNLTAASITSPIIQIADTDGGSTFPVASRAYVDASINKIGKGNQHSHAISVADDGTVTFGYATDTPQSFNVTATKAYRNGVAAAQRAVKINELGRVETSTDSYNSQTHATTVHLQAITEYGQTKLANIVVAGTKAYQDGYNNGASEAAEEAYQRGFDDVDFDRLAVDVSGITYPYDSARERYNIRIPYTAYLENGNDYTSAITADITSFYTSSYNSGRSSVTIKSVVKDPNKNDSYNKSTHKTTVNLLATASNNNTLTGTVTTGTEAYDDGHSVGYSLGLTTGKNSITISSVNLTDSHSVANKYVDVTAVATASNGKTLSNTKRISTEQHYNAGFNAVTLADSNFTFPSVTHDIANKKLTVQAKAVLSNHSSSNNRTYTKSYSVSTVSHYNQGKADGKTEYNPTSVTWASRQVSGKYQVYNSSNKNFTKYISVSAKNAAGTTLITNNSYSVTVDGTEAYNAGKNSVSISGAAALSGSWSPSTTVAIGDANVTYASKVITGGVKVTLSNAATSNIRVQMNATKAYDEGRTKVYNSIAYSSSGYETNDQGSTDYTKIWVKLTTDKGNKTIGNIPSKYEDGRTRVYNSIAYRSSGYETDEYGSTDYGHIWVSLSTDKGNKSIGNIPSKYEDGRTRVYNSIAYRSSGYETDEYGSTDYGHIWVSLSTDKGNKSIGNIPSKYEDGRTRVYNSIAYRSSGYETDEYGSTDYGHIWVSLSTDKGNKSIGNIPSKYWDGYDAGKGSASYATFKIVGVNTSTYEVLVSCTTWGSMYWLSIGDTFDQT